MGIMMDISHSHSKKEEHIAVHVLVGWYPIAYATYNWKTLNPMDFKLGTLFRINMLMIPVTQQVSG